MKMMICVFALGSHGEQVFLRELQVVVVPKPPQHGPCGFVSASLDEECVQEQEACRDITVDVLNL